MTLDPSIGQSAIIPLSSLVAQVSPHFCEGSCRVLLTGESSETSMKASKFPPNFQPLHRHVVLGRQNRQRDGEVTWTHPGSTIAPREILLCHINLLRTRLWRDRARLALQKCTSLLFAHSILHRVGGLDAWKRVACPNRLWYCTDWTNIRRMC